MSSLRWGDIKISATKTMATLFNTWSTKMRTELNVQVEAKIIQTTNYLKVLQITAISDKIKSRNKILKALASSANRPC